MAYQGGPGGLIVLIADVLGDREHLSKQRGHGQQSAGGPWWYWCCRCSGFVLWYIWGPKTAKDVGAWVAAARTGQPQEPMRDGDCGASNIAAS